MVERRQSNNQEEVKGEVGGTIGQQQMRVVDANEE